MRIYPVFRDRLFAPERPLYGVTYRVERYSNSVIGGSDKATITATGNPKYLFELMLRLNYDVELRDSWGDWLWNGFIAEVKLSIGFLEFGISMDRISNKIKVKYSTSSSTGMVSGDTTWAENAKSQALYGVRELIESMNQTDATAANNKRDTLLEIMGIPIPTMNLGSMQGGVVATLECLGWLYSMNNRYYALSDGQEKYESPNPAGREGIAYSIYHHFAAQSFILPSSQEIEYVHWLGGYYGSPLYNIILKIKANGGDNYPGTTLATFDQVAESSMSLGELSWIKAKLASPVTLSPATTYWLHWERDVAGDSSADYAYIAHDYSGIYTNGKAVTWESNFLDPKWTDLGGDFCFMVEATKDVAFKIADIALNVCDYIENIHTAVTAVVRTPIYRKGDYKALNEILALAAQGTSNKRRIRINIMRDRTLGIYEETAYDKNNPDYFLESTGRLYDRQNKPVVKHKCPVGVWVKLRDVLPPGLDVNRLDLIDHFYIESSEYTPATEKMTFTPRGDMSSFDLSAFEAG